VSPRSSPAIRPAARALIIDAEQRLLLFRGDLPDREPWWFAPGGALEPGEIYEEALVREVREETGLAVDVATVPPHVWTRDVEFTWQGQVERHLERFFLIRIHAHEVDTSGFEPVEAAAIRTHRWWGVDDIARSGERFSPTNLADHLAPLLHGCVPHKPVAVGV
jgi:ADP-ribose pyrophosphatase YjhB (NUDIX family)